MGHEVLISVKAGYVYLASVEEGQLVDFRIEPVGAEDQVTGRIYLAQVERVVPRLQAAFVDIGEERAGFLGAREARALVPDATRETPIEDCVGDGDTVLVQVTRPASNDKGAQLTADISLPGRYVVITPCRQNVAVSRAIDDEDERRKMIELAEQARQQIDTEGMDGPPGWVIRTAAAGIDSELLMQDMEHVAGLWDDILDLADDSEPPRLLHQDIGGVERVLRDYVKPETSQIVIEGEAAFHVAKAYCKKVMPLAGDLLAQSDRDEDLFDRHDIHGLIETALSARVNLPSGGWLMIETTEAMTTIDVNSGSHADPALAVNLEAVAMIAGQIPLRGVGGLIAIDFIDMPDAADQQSVITALEAAFSSDKMPVRIGGMSDFGVVEMTRKRDRVPLQKLYQEAKAGATGDEGTV